MNLYESIKILKEDDSNLQKALNLRTSSGGYHGRIAGAVARVKNELNNINEFLQTYKCPKLTYEELIEFVKKYGSPDTDLSMNWFQRIENTPSSYREGIAREYFNDPEVQKELRACINKLKLHYNTEQELKEDISYINDYLKSRGLFPVFSEQPYISDNGVFGKDLKVLVSDQVPNENETKFIRLIPEIKTFSYHRYVYNDGIVYLVPKEVK